MSLSLCIHLCSAMYGCMDRWHTATQIYEFGFFLHYVFLYFLFFAKSLCLCVFVVYGFISVGLIDIYIYIYIWMLDFKIRDFKMTDCHLTFWIYIFTWYVFSDICYFDKFLCLWVLVVYGLIIPVHISSWIYPNLDDIVTLLKPQWLNGCLFVGYFRPVHWSRMRWGWNPCLKVEGWFIICGGGGWARVIPMSETIKGKTLR